MGICIWYIYDRWCLVVFFILVAQIPRCTIWNDRYTNYATLSSAVQYDNGGKYWRRLVSNVFYQERIYPISWQNESNVFNCPFSFIGFTAQPLGGSTFWIPVFLIGIGASAHQAWSANIFTTVSDMFPKKAIRSEERR